MLLGAGVMATLVGLVSVPAGAFVGAIGVIAAFELSLRRWLVPRLRELDMLTDPALWGVVALSAAPFFPARLGPSFQGISLDDLPLLVGSVALVVGVMRREGIRSLWQPVALPIALFAVWSTVAAFIGGDPVTGARSLIRWGVIALAFAAVIAVSRRPGYSRFIIGTVLIVGVLQAGFGLWAYTVDWLVEGEGRLYQIGLERWRSFETPFVDISPGRITGFLGIASNFYGAVLIIPTTLAVAAFSRARERWAIIGYGLAAVVVLTALSLSYTRASLLGALFGLIIVIAAVRNWRVVGLVALMFAVVLVLTPVSQRITYGQNRGDLIRSALTLISKAPIVGIGDYEEGAKEWLTAEELAPISNQQGDVVTPHNSYLRAAAETGLPGGILLLIASMLPGVIVLLGAFRRIPGWVMLAGIAGGLAGFGLQATSNNLFHIPNVAPIYWLVAGAGVGAVLLERQRTRESDQGV